MKKVSLLRRAWVLIMAHKFIATIALIILISGGYYTYGKIQAANTTPQYVVTPARIGTITQTVTGSGQVSAENQLDVTSEVSGKVQSISVTVGQHVTKGQLLASLDAHDAAISLESARIAYAKLVQPAKEGDVINSQNSLNKAYNDGFVAVSSLHLDLPTILNGAKDMLYGQTGFLSDQKSSYLTTTARTYRDTAGLNYDKALAQYVKTSELYKGATRTSATSTIDQLIQDSITTAKQVAIMLQSMQVATTFITTNQPEYNASAAPSAAANVITWSNQISGDLSSIVSAQNTITSTANSLGELVAGAEDLDIQSQRLSLQQAETTYQKYFIRAPFDGVVGRIPVSVYAPASGSTVIATIVGDQKVANISLNEVDAAKVKPGQPVKITFDAIDGLNATGTVGQVDLVGSVSQGVVSYGVKIIITTADDRIKPGMSLNVSIITKETTDVLVVPSAAIKTSGTKKYVEVLAAPAAMASSTARANIGMNGGTDGYFARNASSTDSTPFTMNGSSTRQFGGANISANGTRSMTISSATAPTQITVTLGDSDDTNTQILSGLTRGQLVVTKTIATSAVTASAPSILSGIGGNRAPGASGATRALTR